MVVEGKEIDTQRIENAIQHTEQFLSKGSF